MRIRLAEARDAPAIAFIHVDSWRAAYRGLMPDAVLDGLSLEHRTTQWRERLGDPGERMFTLVAYAPGPAGFCAVATPSRDEDADGRTAEIGALYVAPSHWRRGIGSALLGDALTRLRESGFRAVTLWILDGNDRAAAFYTSHGFELDGERRTHEPTHQPELRMAARIDREGRG